MTDDRVIRAPIAGDLALNKPGAGARRVAADIQRRAAHSSVGRQVDALAQAHNWIVGAEGETRAAAAFTNLGPEWNVLHDVTIEVTGANLDHVLIGPPGVFVVNTKHRPAAVITVNGDQLLVGEHHTGYIRDSEWEAKRSSIRLRDVLGQPVWVTPVLLFVGHDTLTVNRAPSNVRVVAEHDVVEWLQGQPARLDPAAVENIAYVARHPETWLPPAAPSPEPNPYGYWTRALLSGETGHTPAPRKTGVRRPDHLRRPVKQPLHARHGLSLGQVEAALLRTEPATRHRSGTKATPRGSRTARRVSGKEPRSSGSALLAFLFTAVVAFGVVQMAPMIGNLAGEQFAESLHDKEVVESPEQKAAARARDARNKFLPAARNHHTRLVKGRTDRQVAALATYTCTVFDDYHSKPRYQEHLTRHLTKRLNSPTPAQVGKVIGLAVNTTCPDKEFLAAQIE